MSLHEDLFVALTAETEPLRVYADTLPAKVVLPALTYFIVGGHDEIYMEGDAGLVRRLVQVDAWAGTRIAAEAAMERAKALLLAATTFSVAAIDVVDITGVTQAGFEPDTERYRCSREFAVWAN